MQGFHVVMTRWGYAIAIAALVILAALFLISDAGEKPIEGRSKYQDFRAYWQANFDTKPSREVYAEFLREGNALSYDDAHTLSHIIGEELYARESFSGLSLCTQDFGFGCYHGFSGAVLSDRGLRAVATLSEPCEGMERGALLGCIHGIGHGILSFLGNDNIIEALEACTDAQNNEPIGGCYGGVVMEYNYNTMQSEAGIALRPYDERYAYEPCVSIPETFRMACMYEQPSWWHSSMDSLGNAPQIKLFEYMGKMCDKVDDRSLRQICFRGTGNVAGPRSDYVASEMKNLCSVMPDEEARDLCYGEALPHLMQTAAGKQQLRELCKAGTLSNPDICGSDAL